EAHRLAAQAQLDAVRRRGGYRVGRDAAQAGEQLAQCLAGLLGADAVYHQHADRAALVSFGRHGLTLSPSLPHAWPFAPKLAASDSTVKSDARQDCRAAAQKRNR